MNPRTDRATGDSIGAPRPGGGLCKRLTHAMVWVLGIALLIHQPQAQAAEGDLILPTSDPIADPIVHSEALFFARKVTAWEHDGASWLWLQGDAGFALGVYGFSADAAIVPHRHRAKARPNHPAPVDLPGQRPTPARTRSGLGRGATPAGHGLDDRRRAGAQRPV